MNRNKQGSYKETKQMSKLSSEVPLEVEDVLVNLGILSGIPPGTKYNVHSKTYTSAKSWLGSIQRTVEHYLYNEQRDTVVNEFRKQIRKAVEIAVDFSRWKNTIKESVKALHNSIINQKHVYSDDPSISKKFELLLDVVTEEAFEEAYNEKLDEKKNGKLDGKKS